MKRYIALLFLFISFVLNAQFGELATTEVDIIKKEGDTYELKFILHLVNGAWTYGDSEDVMAPPGFTLNLHESHEYKALGGWVFPKFKDKYIEEFEANAKYFKGGDFVVTHLIESKVKDFTVSGDFSGQVCVEGKCIPSEFPNPNFEINVGKGSIAPYKLSHAEDVPNQTNASFIEGSKSFKDVECVYDFSKEDNKLKTFNGKVVDNGFNSTYWETFLIAFIVGIGALLTPCVFPMIPMTVSFFLKGAESKSKGKLTAVVFGLSIIIIYVLIGSVFTTVLNEDAAGLIATHWLPNMFFFAVFIFFAASFFGMFELTLPSKWTTASDQKADKGGIGGAVFMALTLALVSFSCTGPVVGTVLIQSVKVGGIQPIVGMLGFSIAFALPFTLFAFFPSMLKSMPKSGGWLNSVKVVFGFLELALALKFLSIADQTQHWGILDRDVFLALWIVIFTLLGLYLLGKLKFSHDSDLPFLKVPRFLLSIFTFAFVVYLLPGMWGAPLKGLSGYLPPMSTMDFNKQRYVQAENEICGEASYSEKLHLPYGLKGYFDYEEGMCCAKEQGKPVFIDFTGLSCSNCRDVEQRVWTDPVVLEILQKDFVIISLFADEHTLKIDKPYTSIFNGEKKIKTVGQKAADIQKTWFGLYSQPYYATMDNEKELLQIPIDYDIAKHKNDFLKFLKNSLREYKKRNP